MKVKESRSNTEFLTVSELHQCDNPFTKYSSVLLTCVGCVLPAKFPMDKDCSGCIYTTANENLIDLNILCSCHLVSLQNIIHSVSDRHSDELFFFAYNKF